MRLFSNLPRVVRVLRVGLACFAVAALFGGATADAKEAPAAKRAASLLASGKGAEALAAAYEALATAPDDVALLELASQAAEKAERKDEALSAFERSVEIAGENDPRPQIERAKSEIARISSGVATE